MPRSSAAGTGTLPSRLSSSDNAHPCTCFSGIPPLSAIALTQHTPHTAGASSEGRSEGSEDSARERTCSPRTRGARSGACRRAIPPSPAHARGATRIKRGHSTPAGGREMTLNRKTTRHGAAREEDGRWSAPLRVCLCAPGPCVPARDLCACCAPVRKGCLRVRASARVCGVRMRGWAYRVGRGRRPTLTVPSGWASSTHRRSSANRWTRVCSAACCSRCAPAGLPRLLRYEYSHTAAGRKWPGVCTPSTHGARGLAKGC